ncbi:MAG: response regulator [Acidobacteria bacterium]|nr:response regulator [Acidobacteriota bacterium]
MSYKILLADDSVTVQKIITLTFSDEGVDVVTVNNGDEAIARLQHLRPALVMADVSIPGRNGYDICEFVKTHPDMKDTPVILLVPAFEPFDEERARRIGADCHLTKPFQSIRTLISTVKSLVERRAAPEVSITTGGLVAVHGAERQWAEAAEIDPKRAKIEELIKLSAQSPAEGAAEDDILSEIDLTQSESKQADSLAIAEMRDELEIIGHHPIIEDHYAPTVNGPVVMDSQISTEALAGDSENVLELDDLFSEAAPRPLVVGVAPAPAATLAEPEIPHFPQSVIDEIVSRVVAQLSEKLSDEIARRVASEIAELVKQPRLAEPVAYPETDNLLDLD